MTDTPNMEEIKEDCAKRQKTKDQERVKKNIYQKALKKKSAKDNTTQKNFIKDLDSDTSDTVVSSASSEITDIDEQIRNEVEEINFISGTITIDDFNLVKFATKKSCKYYVAKVMGIYSI